MKTKEPEATEIVEFSCECGGNWKQRTKHYEVIKCNCGKFWWSLRPKRDGPLKAFPYPQPELKRWEPAPARS